MREMLRNAGHMNARNGGLLPLTVVLFSVLAFVASFLLVVSVPTYADSVQSAQSAEGDVSEGQSSASDALAAQETPSPAGQPEVTLKDESAVGDGALVNDGVAEKTAAAESVNAPQSDVPAAKPRGRFRRAAAITAESCRSGEVFSVSEDGGIYKIRGMSKELVASVPNPYSFYRTGQVNALGVSSDAETIFVIRHWWAHKEKPQGGWRAPIAGEWMTWRYIIYRYTPATDKWYAVTNFNPTPLSIPFIAGAVDPRSGDFYFGGFDSRDNSSRILYFNIWKYSPSLNSFFSMGFFDTGLRIPPNHDQSGYANGDMGFDGKGNLFVVRGSGGTTSLYSVGVGQLANPTPEEEATGRLLSAQATGAVASGIDVNGIAFDQSGRVYLGDRHNLTAHDPLNFRNLHLSTPALTRSNDLATCESPITLVVEKKVEGRAHPDDEFKLSLRMGQTSIASKETPGYESLGLSNGALENARRRSEKLGPFPVHAGERLTISEEMTASSLSSMGNYRTSWKCTGPWSPQNEPGENSTSGTFTVPSKPGAEIVCTFTNTSQSGSLVWEKVDEDNRSAHLEGSVWTLSAPLLSGRSQTVRDCVAANVSQCRAVDNDTDPRAGYFRVDGLYLGRYTLREQTPPSGYEGTTQTFTQTLTADKQQRSFGKIDNKKLVAQIEVKKEVLDPAGVKVADASGWTLAVDLESHLHGTLSPLKDSDPWFGKHQVSNASGTVPELWTVSFPNSATRQDVRITEAAKHASYSASIRCTSNKRQPVEGTGSGLNVRSLQPGEKLTCVVTNKQLPGAAVWEKTDASGTHLSGSEWSVTTTQQGVINVQDCVKAGACQNGGDRDPQPGRFRLEGLKWQNLSLEETAAPPGYRRDTAVRTQTIGENALQANFGRITNEIVTLPLLPLTGGMGADSFLMAGAGILTLAFGAAAMRRLHPAGNNSLSTQSLYGEMIERG